MMATDRDRNVRNYEIKGLPPANYFLFSFISDPPLTSLAMPSFFSLRHRGIELFDYLVYELTARNGVRASLYFVVDKSDSFNNDLLHNFDVRTQLPKTDPGGHFMSFDYG